MNFITAQAMREEANALKKSNGSFPNVSWQQEVCHSRATGDLLQIKTGWREQDGLQEGGLIPIVHTSSANSFTSTLPEHLIPRPKIPTRHF